MRFLLHLYVWVLAGGCLVVTAAEPIEEITVTGDQADLHLQVVIDTAETDFYAVFNELVEEEYRITCKQEVVLGSRIKKQLCQTGYQKEQLTRAATYSYFGMPYNADAALAAKNSKLRTMARELLETNGELRQAATRLSDLVELYQDRYTNPD